MLVKGAQSLDGVGWEVGVPVLAAAEAADGPLSMAFLVIYLDLSRAKLVFFFILRQIVKTQSTSKKEKNEKLNAFLVAEFGQLLIKLA